MAQTILPGTRILTNGSERFKEIADAKYGVLLSGVPEFMKRTTYLLENTTGKTVLGYVMKWTIQSDRQSQSRFTVIDVLDLMSRNSKTNIGLGIQPHSTRLFNSIFNVSESEVFTDSTRILDTLKKKQEQLDKSGREQAHPEPSLDLIVYEDGTFEGPDEKQFSELMAIDREAKHDAGVWVLLHQQQGMSDSDIQAGLRDQVSSNQHTIGESHSERYRRLRARYASQLLSTRQTIGEDALKQSATRYASLPKLVLSRSIGTQIPPSDVMRGSAHP